MMGMGLKVPYIEPLLRPLQAGRVKMYERQEGPVVLLADGFGVLPWPGQG